MLRIVITGPESSGKTTLAKALAARYKAPYVPEYARIYLEERGPSYGLEDLIRIAEGQLALAEARMREEPSASHIFIDTWMLEIRVWAQYRYDMVPEMIEQAYHTYHPDIYLLCAPDILWEADPLRENPHDRDILYGLYTEALEQTGIPFVTLTGSASGREVAAQTAISRLSKPVS
jgi:nicotinamide riboside kinase